MTDKTQNGDKTLSGKAGSKFSGLLAAVKDRQEDETPPEAPPNYEAAPNHEQASPIKGVQAGDGRRSPGRPRGKRSNAEFVQVTAYVGKGTHRDVKIALLTEGAGREFSELVEDLLIRWLQSPR